MSHRTVTEAPHGASDHNRHISAGHGHGPHGHGHGLITEAPTSDAGAPRRSWTVLAVMLMAQFMVVLDVSVVNVALPSIGRALDFRSGDFQWVVSAYVLLSGGLLLLGGRLADLLDRRTTFLTGLGLFTAASVLSGLATSPLMLIVSRAAQGAGAALLTPAALSIVMATYAGRQRAVALSLWGTIASMGIGAGVLFGGLLTTALGWRAVFFINAPIGLIAAVLTSHLIPTASSGHKIVQRLRGIDLPGALTAVAGLIATVYAIEATRESGWTSPNTVISGLVAAGLLTAFARIEQRVSAPLVPPATWRIRSLTTATAVMAGVTGVVVGAIFLSSMLLQQVMGNSAVVTGLCFLPLAAAITVSAAAASKLLPHTGPKPLMIAGLVIAAGGALLLAGMGTSPGYLADVLPGFLILGAGVGPMFVAISVAAMAHVPSSTSGLASGLMMTGHEIGAALGVASLSAIAGALVTPADIATAYPRALTAIWILLVALAAFALAAVPNPRGEQAAAAGHGHH
jgi:EmrB/QacA subfamily drug resistance transporter